MNRIQLPGTDYYGELPRHSIELGFTVAVCVDNMYLNGFM